MGPVRAIFRGAPRVSSALLSAQKTYFKSRIPERAADLRTTPGRSGSTLRGVARPCDGDYHAREGAARNVEHVLAFLGDEGAAAFEAITALEDKLGVLAGRVIEATVILDEAMGAHLPHRLTVEGFLRRDQGAPERLDGHAGLKIGRVSVFWPGG